MEQGTELTEEQKQANRKQAKERLQYEGKLPAKDGKNGYVKPWE